LQEKEAEKEEKDNLIAEQANKLAEMKEVAPNNHYQLHMINDLLFVGC
jgi:hypothetical protein